MNTCDIDVRRLRVRRFISPHRMFQRADGGKVRGSSHADAGWLERYLDACGYRYRIKPDHDNRWQGSMEGTRAFVAYLEDNDIILDGPWTAIYVKCGNCYARYVSEVVFAFKADTDAVKARMFL